MIHYFDFTCQLETNEEEKSILEEVITEFHNCCDFVESNFPQTIQNRIELKNILYKEARKKFRLPATMLTECIFEVARKRKNKSRLITNETKNTFAIYNKNTITLKKDNQTVTMATLTKRISLKLKLNKYQKYLLEDQKLNIVHLIKKNNSFWLKFFLKSENNYNKNSQNPVEIPHENTNHCTNTIENPEQVPLELIPNKQIHKINES